MNNNKNKIAIDCDDAAVSLKETIFSHLSAQGFDITDLKYTQYKKADYPEIGYNLALRIREGSFDRGILICGTGIGMSIIANKVEGIRAGLCHDVYSAERLSKSNDAQIITLGARVIGPELAKKVVDAWLDSEFEKGRSLPKVMKIEELEKLSFRNKSTG